MLDGEKQYKYNLHSSLVLKLETSHGVCTDLICTPLYLSTVPTNKLFELVDNGSAIFNASLLLANLDIL